MQDMTCVLNLRGNAHELRLQSKLLLQGTSVSVIIVDDENELYGEFDKNFLEKSSSHIILVDCGGSSKNGRKKIHFGKKVGISIQGKNMTSLQIAHEVLKVS